MIRFLKEEHKIDLAEKYIELLEYKEDDSVIDLREDHTYGTDLSVKNEENIDKMRENCKEILHFTKDIVYA